MKQYLRHPFKYAFYAMSARNMLNWMPDKTYLKIRYKFRMDKKLILENPQTYNEKLQWLKLYNRKPEYTRMVDKYEVKEYVAEMIGAEYIIPTLGVWERFDDIDFEKLPNQFVLKCTHDSGGLVICRDKSRLDINVARNKIERCLKKNYFWVGREWPYKNVKPRIIAEQYMEDKVTGELRDYKFFCFDGEPKVMYVVTERMNTDTETRYDFFDMDYNHLDIRDKHPNADMQPVKPLSFEHMCSLAKKLSQNIPHLRVDFYEVNGRIYFGELTFAHNSGMVRLEPEEWDKTLGEWITLPEKTV